jgi:hypothetical protein
MMSTTSDHAKPPRRWFWAWRSAAAGPVGTDPADLGTAFGLDLSLAPAVEPARPQPAPPVLARRSWKARLGVGGTKPA